ncbi:MAG: hypothetical protein BWK73_26810 [Thiothrix lacustris]|uniref:Uncharacterized protein n=1 Tax=Thiothrix lacustris TaxID=525917 RepID=A0A1Y1QL25_9GAMM|nr:MAG: hypothetical protein BWK73_26810 [Thiothrix lacustris]
MGVFQMIFEQKVKLLGVGSLASIAAAVFALGTTKAIQGSALYMTAAEGRTEAEGLMYAAMIAGTAMLASNAAVFMQNKLARVGFTTLAISLAALTIYTTHAGKAYDSDVQIDTTRQSDRERILTEINEYQKNIQRLSESLVKNTEDSTSTDDLPAITTCDKNSKRYTQCNANRTKQMEANTKLLQAAGTGTQTLSKSLDDAKKDKSAAESRLEAFDNETKRLKIEKRHDSLLTNVISSVLPELSSLLGSFFLGFFLKAMYLILQENHMGQFAGQLRDSCGTVWDSEVSRPENGMTRSEIEQWSVISTMSPVQQTAQTPNGAEAEFSAAIDAKTAPLSNRSARAAFPMVTKRRVPEIFEEKFSSKILNCRIDGKGNRNYEYPPEGEEGGNTYYTETAAARRAPVRGIYLAANRGLAV